MDLELLYIDSIIIDIIIAIAAVTAIVAYSS